MEEKFGRKHGLLSMVKVEKGGFAGYELCVFEGRVALAQAFFRSPGFAVPRMHLHLLPFFFLSSINRYSL